MKIIKRPNIVDVGTHPGVFHLDDAMAVAELSLYYRLKGKKIRIWRTRNQKILEQMDERVDVGKKNDETNHDHHQIGGAGIRKNGVPYAASGIVWQKIGRAICPSEWVFNKIDYFFMEPIDAWDAGDFERTAKFEDHLLPTLFHIVNAWRESAKTERKMKQHFKKVVTFFAETLTHEIERLKKKEALMNAEIAKKSEREKKRINTEFRLVKILDDQTKIAETLAIHPELCFVIYPQNQKLTRWIVCAVKRPSDKGKKQNLFPESWSKAGQTKLQELTGSKDILSCQKSRRFATALSLEGAKKIAEAALIATASSIAA